MAGNAPGPYVASGHGTKTIGNPTDQPIEIFLSASSENGGISEFQTDHETSEDPQSPELIPVAVDSSGNVQGAVQAAPTLPPTDEIEVHNSGGLQDGEATLNLLGAVAGTTTDSWTPEEDGMSFHSTTLTGTEYGDVDVVIRRSITDDGVSYGVIEAHVAQGTAPPRRVVPFEPTTDDETAPTSDVPTGTEPVAVTQPTGTPAESFAAQVFRTPTADDPNATQTGAEILGPNMPATDLFVAGSTPITDGLNDTATALVPGADRQTALTTLDLYYQMQAWGTGLTDSYEEAGTNAEDLAMLEADLASLQTALDSYTDALEADTSLGMPTA
jgi:hypothetical protein